MLQIVDLLEWKCRTLLPSNQPVEIQISGITDKASAETRQNLFRLGGCGKFYLLCVLIPGIAVQRLH
jgi:hypothetical protein